MTNEQTYSLLIPRYLRGELSADERAEFESYRDENPDFQTDIEFQRNLMAARPDDNTPIDLEFGWAKLSRSIDALEAKESPSLDRLTVDTPQNTSVLGNMWKIAAVMLACLSVGQALYITNSDPSEYQLASEKDAAGVTLQVGFESSLSLNEISRFLVEHKSQIIAGPGKLEIYTLSFSDMQRCESAIKALTSKEQFVETYTSCHASSKG